MNADRRYRHGKAGPESPHEPPRPAPRIVVLVGSSAGGIEPLGRLLGMLRRGIGLCVVVAQHLAPTQNSFLVQILKGLTPLDVVAATDLGELEADTVYVAPPGHDIYFEGDRLRLATAPRRVAPMPSVDRLFESRAADPDGSARTVAIVLSGLGWDGSVGIAALKRAGAVTLAQLPSEAGAPGMPESALATGCVDLAGSVATLGAALPRLADMFSANPAPMPDSVLLMVERALGCWGDLAIDRFDSDLVAAAVACRRALKGHAGAEDYAERVSTDREEAHALWRHMLHPLSSFDLERPRCKGLRPALGAAFRAHPRSGIFRVWDVGCAAGEGACALAIELAEIREREGLDTEFVIYGTDVLADLVSAARLGTYTEAEIGGLSRPLVVRHFAPRARFLQVRRDLQRRMLFAVHDLVSDLPLPGMNFIACTDLLHRFRDPVAKEVRAKLVASLVPGGRLFDGGGTIVPEQALSPRRGP